MSKWLDTQEIRRAIALLVVPGDVFEIRILEGRRRPADDYRPNFYGYFDSVEPAIAALDTLKGGWAGAYLTLNPCLPELMSRVANRLDRAKTDDLTKDGEVTRRRWLLVDVDAQRPKGIASTDAQHRAAHAKAAIVKAALARVGFGEPAIADSGNGAHLLYRVDLPVKDETVPRVLKALHALLSDEQGETKHVTPAGGIRVCVDVTVGNPARICKLYGTLVAKGEHSAERPHRMARLLSVPAELVPVPLDVLQAFAPEAAPVVRPARATTATRAPAAALAPTGGAFDAVAFVTGAGLDLKPAKRLDDGGELYELKACPCPRGEAKSYLTVASSGAVGLACQNASCAYSRGSGSPGDHWRAFRSEHDADYGADLEGERQRERSSVADWARARVASKPALPPKPAARATTATIDGGAFLGPAVPAPPLPAIDATAIVWPVADNKGNPRKGYIENTRALLDAYGVTVKHSLMAHETEIRASSWGAVPGEIARNYGLASVRIAAERHGLAKDSVTEHLIVIAEPYHPVRDWLAGVEHDGIDRASRLFETITLKDDADVDLCRMLFGYWLRQCAAAALLPDGQFRASGVLVVQGVQNRGKTRWLESLAPAEHRAAWVATGVALDPHDRDSIQQLTSYWLAELGEIEATFRRDVAMLKAMITRPFDVYRQAYARSPERVPRRTVFYGSVNKPDYLIDDTGNRRFWTLPVTGMDADHDIDLRQLWAQVAAEVAGGGRYWLTPDESDYLETQNARFRVGDTLAAELWSVWQAVPLEAADAPASAGKTLAEIWAAMPSGAAGKVPDRTLAGRMGAILADCRRKQVRNGNATFRVQLVPTEPVDSRSYYDGGRYGRD